MVDAMPEEAFLDYELPSERIAAWPAAERRGARDAALLLHARRGEGSLALNTRRFTELPGLLRPDDVLVLNNSRVLPYRFFCRLPGGGALEILLVSPGQGEGVWLALAQPMRKLRPGMSLALAPTITAEVGERTPSGELISIRLSAAPGTSVPLPQLLERHGGMPIPPYIRRGVGEERDRELYQTVYARVPGSVAAPTAGLHFTPEVLERIKERGVEVIELTLHVGAMSILAPREAGLYSERFIIAAAAWERLHEARAARRRIVVVGTTSARALESAAALGEGFRPGELQETSLLIKPGFRFSFVDAMITNFHQPQSSHLYLVSAFFGGGALREVYDYALQREFRFLSYGDSMFLEYER